jgi:hypothetical protein
MHYLNFLSRCKKCSHYDSEEDVCDNDCVGFKQSKRILLSLAVNDLDRVYFCDEFIYDQDKDLDNEGDI